MAVWQFSLTIIPKKAVIEQFNYIPNKFRVFLDSDSVRKYSIPTENFRNEEVFSDQHWWNSTDIQPIEIIQQIDQYVKRTIYGEKNEFSLIWKTHIRDVLDNDAWLSIDKQTGKIKSLSFRADFRDRSLTFLKQMVLLAQHYDWLFLDKNGNLVEPNIYKLVELIKTSKSFRILQNLESSTDDVDISTVE